MPAHQIQQDILTAAVICPSDFAPRNVTFVVASLAISVTEIVLSEKQEEATCVVVNAPPVFFYRSDALNNVREMELLPIR